MPIPMPPPRPVKLYDSGAVGLATFLGTPAAGSVLMALNYKRLGDTSKAALAVVIGVLATGALVAIGLALPSGPLTTGLGFGSLFATIGLAKSLQGKTVEDHRNAGGKVGSRWFGAAVGLIGLVIFFGAIFGYVMATSLPHGTRLAVGPKDEIYYSGSATEADARALGEALKKDGFFQDRGATVQLHKDADGTLLSFTVNEGVWDDPKMVDGFAAVTRQVAGSVGGLPIKLRLLNTAGEVKTERQVQ
jgi:hypothetical protein